MSRQPLFQARSLSGETAHFPALQEEINRPLNPFRTGSLTLEDDGRALFEGSSFAASEVVETDDPSEVSADMLGVKEDDLDVTVSGETLVLTGEKSADHEEYEYSYHLIEQRDGSFRRHIPLGFGPEDGAVDAYFVDGILKLSIAKPANADVGVQQISITKN